MSAFARTLLATLATSYLLTACGDDAPPMLREPAPRPVRVATPQPGPAVQPVVATGVLAPLDDARLAFKVGGIIADITVRAGDRVTAGQTLATLEAAEVDAMVAQAQAAHAKAVRDLERGRQLFDEAVITREQLDDLQTAETVAAAQLRTAAFNRRHATIEAPAAGMVLRRLAEPRELIAAGQPVLHIGTGDSGWILKLGVPDREFVRLHADDAATVHFDAYPNRAFEARIRTIGGAADPQTGTFPVELSVSPGDAKLASGMIGRARIQPKDTSETDYVPLSALVEGGADGVVVFLYDENTGRVSEQRVPVRFVSGTQAALASALPDGSRIVTDGSSYLQDGDSVRIVN